MRRLIGPVLVVGLAVLFFCAGPANAITMLIGDVDSFGWPPAAIPALIGPDGGLADRNSDVKLTAGDVLPDTNPAGGDLDVSALSEDNWDNRSASEKTDANRKWTDVTLSTTFQGAGEAPGVPDDVVFTFNFAVPNPGDPDYDLPHFLNVVAGDLDVDPLNLLVDGVSTPLQNIGTDDGLITLTYVDVPWATLTDGELIVAFATPDDPYVAIDYVLLDTEVREAVPEPSGLALGLLGLGGLGLRRRRRS